MIFYIIMGVWLFSIVMSLFMAVAIPYYVFSGKYRAYLIQEDINMLKGDKNNDL